MTVSVITPVAVAPVLSPFSLFSLFTIHPVITFILPLKRDGVSAFFANFAYIIIMI